MNEGIADRHMPSGYLVVSQAGFVRIPQRSGVSRKWQDFHNSRCFDRQSAARPPLAINAIEKAG